MKVLFFTSGSGSTASYLTSMIKQSSNGIQLTHSGFVFEPNAEIEDRLAK